jgi:hypothetical protein
MARKAEGRVARVQVYFDNPKLLAALRRAARGDRVSLSRAAERAIHRGLMSAEADDPGGRAAFEKALGDHTRRAARDMGILQELLVELARAVFLRLPDSPADHDPLMQAAAQARIERLLSAAAGKIIAGGSLASAQIGEPGDLPSGAPAGAAQASP